MGTHADSTHPADKVNQARQRAEADLLSGIVVLMGYAKNGTPWVILNGSPDTAQETLAQVLEAVEPSDLLPSSRVLWSKLREGKTPELPAWVIEQGLGLGYGAPAAARRVLHLAAARQRYDAALGEAAVALEAMSNS